SVERAFLRLLRRLSYRLHFVPGFPQTFRPLVFIHMITSFSTRSLCHLTRSSDQKITSCFLPVFKLVPNGIRVYWQGTRICRSAPNCVAFLKNVLMRISLAW